MFRFLLAWTNDWGAAEDLTQDSYIRLWRKRDSVDWSRPILGWLLVTARRLATSRFHSLKRVLNQGTPDQDWDESTRVAWMDVRRALGVLTPTERAALVLTTVEGWSYAEVAAACQTSDVALRAAVSRARKKLEAQ